MGYLIYVQPIGRCPMFLFLFPWLEDISSHREILHIDINRDVHLILILLLSEYELFVNYALRKKQNGFNLSTCGAMFVCQLLCCWKNINNEFVAGLDMVCPNVAFCCIIKQTEWIN